MDAEHPAQQQIGRVTLVADGEYLGAALSFIREAAGRLGLAEPNVTALVRAVEEVSLNVIEHALSLSGAARYIVPCAGQVVVAVEDRGLPFDWKLLEASAHSGLTVPSLTGFADAVRFSNLGPRGNRVEIVKRLPFAAIDAYPGTVTPSAVAPAAVDPQASPVTLRLMTPDDAVAVAQCTYAVYGYTVPDETSLPDTIARAARRPSRGLRGSDRQGRDRKLSHAGSGPTRRGGRLPGRGHGRAALPRPSPARADAGVLRPACHGTANARPLRRGGHGAPLFPEEQYRARRHRDRDPTRR